jgi:alanine-synthesizing transaminase
MRRDIIHPGAYELTYEIREVVEVGKKLQSLGVPIYWENIGDPIAKGKEMPKWIKEAVADEMVKNDSVWGYSPTRGLEEAREYIAKIRNAEGGVKISPEDILFTNGLGDAIQTAFMYLHQNARVLGPNPAYPTHSSAEGAHAKSEHLTYDLLPEQGWLPDLEDIHNKVKYNPQISGLLIINPDNPTGIVYPEKILKGMVDIAKEFDLFVMSDEIYANIVFGEVPMTPLSKVLDDVPGLAMRGLSKEVPWPGSRCGWIEFYNTDKDKNFAGFAKAVFDAKQLEVCSTTLPQAVLPKILSDERYQSHLKANALEYAKRADMLMDTLGDIDGLTVVKPQGAFYASPVFSKGVLNGKQKLEIKDSKVREYMDNLVQNVPNDKRFTYYIMAATGICVVPLSGMNSQLDGFRMTLLEPDLERFTWLLNTLKQAIKDYISS